jgi:V/A-type H+-transporting ATPase subunit F
MNSSENTLSSIAVVADEETVTGFRLGGIKESHPVESAEETKEIIKNLMDKNISIIITTENIGDELRDFIDNIKKNRTLPIIVEIPDKNGPMERTTDPLSELVKRAIGIDAIK